MSETPEKDEQHEFIRRLEELKRTTRALIAQADRVSDDAKRTAARLCKSNSGRSFALEERDARGQS